MKLAYRGTFKLALLVDELFAAFPEWVYDHRGDRYTDVMLREKGDGIILRVPGEPDVDAINAVVLAHDPTKESKGEKNEAKRKKDRASAHAKLMALGLTVDEIKAL